MEDIVSAFANCVRNSFHLIENKQHLINLDSRGKEEKMLMIRMLTSELIFEMTHSNPSLPLLAFALIVEVIIPSM